MKYVSESSSKETVPFIKELAKVFEKTSMDGNKENATSIVDKQV